jgi:hypothetical protein
MEARATYRGTGFSKSLIAVVAILVAFVLAAASGYIARNAASQPVPATHVVKGQSTASENAWNDSIRHGGTQSVEGPAALASPRQSPDAQDRNSGLSGQPFSETHGY